MGSFQDIDFNSIALANMGLIHAQVIGDLPKIVDGGQRVIVAKNGVFVESDYEWLHAIKRVGNIGISVPYGILSEKIELRFGKFPKSIFMDFYKMAKDAFPLEAFAYIYWDRNTNDIKLVEGVVLEATSEKVSYSPVEVPDGLVCIGDVHSHPNSHAYYSELDDEDDREGVKCSFVIGLSPANTMNS